MDVFFVRNILNLFGRTTTKEWQININQVTAYGKSFCFGLIRGLFDSESYVYDNKKRIHGQIVFGSSNGKGASSLSNLLNHFLHLWVFVFYS